jgi:hypothetical protein
MVDGKGEPLKMSHEMRSKHLYICGATGTGKLKMLDSVRSGQNPTCLW